MDGKPIKLPNIPPPTVPGVKPPGPPEKPPLSAVAAVAAEAPPQHHGEKKPYDTNWRQKHEEHLETVKTQKTIHAEIEAHFAAGGTAADLPPAPPLDTSDYVTCPHCGRRFNQDAAERHIPACKDMIHNKPARGHSLAPTPAAAAAVAAATAIAAPAAAAAAQQKKKGSDPKPNPPPKK